MTAEGNLEFIENAVRSMVEHVLPYLTQVVGVVDHDTGSYLGSGFFCEIEGMKLVVTAAHVVHQADPERFKGIVFTRGDGEAPGVVDGALFLFDSLDLALYVPLLDFPLPSTKRYWPGNRIDDDGESIHRDYLVLAGFPGRFSRSTGLGGGGMTSEAMVYGTMMRYRENDVPEGKREQFDRDLPEYPFLPSDSLEPHEFAIHFDAAAEMFLDPQSDTDDARRVADWLETFEKGGAAPGMRPVGPGGLSGSPVFRVGAARGTDEWSPDRSRLVGVVTRWLPEHKALVATSSATLLEAFAEAIRSHDG